MNASRYVAEILISTKVLLAIITYLGINPARLSIRKKP